MRRPRRAGGAVTVRPGPAVAGAILAIGATVGLGALSQAPYQSETATHGVIRLAWRTRSVTAKECRTLTPEELENVPVHMRQTEKCEARTIPYLLSVTVDGDTLVNEEIHARGAREDRPLFVLHDLPVAPGSHHLSIWFTRVGEPSVTPEGSAATPARLELHQRIELTERQIVLVTYDADTRALVIPGPSESH